MKMSLTKKVGIIVCINTQVVSTLAQSVTGLRPNEFQLNWLLLEIRPLSRPIEWFI